MAASRVQLRHMLCSLSDMRKVPEFISECIDIAPDLTVHCTTGTLQHLRDALPARYHPNLVSIYDYCAVPQETQNIVKTLNTKVYLGILTDPGNAEHARVIAEQNIILFDAVLANFYTEAMDIGGPAMVRAAAKNAARVLAITHRSQFSPLLRALRTGAGTTETTERRRHARTALRHVTRYVRGLRKLV